MDTFHDEDTGEIDRIRQRLELPLDSEDRAIELLRLGICHEKRQAWQEAVDAYSGAVEIGTPDQKLQYFSFNNLGYSLIQLRRFAEAEGPCLRAIEVDSERHNAYKNLGLAFQGQERWLDAALCFVKAYGICPADRRAWVHLEQLLHAYPDLPDTSPELAQAILDLAGSTSMVSRDRKPERQYLA
jgi:tetratricopeptide (TPR) repeat protein